MTTSALTLSKVFAACFLSLLSLTLSLAGAQTTGGSLHCLPNPVIVGSPFQFVGIIDPIILERGHQQGNKTQCDLTSAFPFIQFLEPNMNVPIPEGPNVLKVDAIILKCPAQLPKTLDASFTCAVIRASDSKTIESSKAVVRMRAIPGYAFDSRVEYTTTEQSVVTHVILENVINTLPSEGVSCDVHWDETVLQPKAETAAELKTLWVDERGRNVTLEPEQAPPCTISALDKPPMACRFGDFIGHNFKTLSLSFSRVNMDAQSAEVSVTCSAQGFDSPCVIAGTRATISLPQPVRVKLEGPPASKKIPAGGNFELKLSVTGTPAATCEVSFLPSSYHVTKPVPTCNATDETHQRCNVKGDKLTIFSVHVDSSAQEGDAAFRVLCDGPPEFASSLSLQVVKEATLELNVSKKRNPSATKEMLLVMDVTNKGPSDVGDIHCDIYHDKEMAKLPKVKDGKCTTTTTSDGWASSCDISKGLPGWGMDGKPSVQRIELEAPFVIDETWLNTTYHFNVCCSFTAGAQKLQSGLVCQSVHSSLADVDTKPPPTTDVNGTKDSSFWTYTLVISNLFLIALVVFVGMWFRNRAVARSMAAAQRVDHFTELESFDSRPLSKAE